MDCGVEMANTEFDFNLLRRFAWAAKREEEIEKTHKAGFIHSDMPITNPVILHISEETLKKLKRLSNHDRCRDNRAN
jgi:hypothetical protein